MWELPRVGNIKKWNWKVPALVLAFLTFQGSEIWQMAKLVFDFPSAKQVSSCSIVVDIADYELGGPGSNLS